MADGDPTPSGFDAVVMADWSASSAPGRVGGGPDGLWVAVAEPGQPDRAIPFRTRDEAGEGIRGLLTRLVDTGHRVLCGFDFAFGYPAGTAAALGAPRGAEQWRWMWRLLDREVIDGVRNRNNRFEVASDLNKRMRGRPGPFWGRPKQRSLSYLSTTKTTFPVRLASGRTVPEFRHAETYRRERGAQPKSVWQLLGAGAVGSQTLLGIPYLHRIRHSPSMWGRCVVWPFETGFALPSARRPLVVLAEVYPSLLTADPTLHDVRDAAQVLALVDGYRQMQDRGELADAFATPDIAPDALHQAVDEEGWMLPVVRGRSVGVAPDRPTLRRGALLPAGAAPRVGERFVELLAHRGVVVEQILSSRRPEDAPYDQDHDEWVVLLDGDATLDVDGETVTMTAGEWVFLPARTPHRVLATDQGSRWLSVQIHHDG